MHADFLLGLDRTNLTTESGTSGGDYNIALLAVAAEIHLHLVLAELGFSEEEARSFAGWQWVRERAKVEIFGQTGGRRHDLWRLLTPSAIESPFVDHLQRLLFDSERFERNDPGRYRRWADIAQRFFGQDGPLKLKDFDAFWGASRFWLSRTLKSEPHTKKWRQAAVALCDALRHVAARVAPLVEQRDYEDLLAEDWIPLPDRLSSGETGARERLYVRRGQTDESAGDALHLPRALLDARRAVTSYTFPGGFADDELRPTGTIAFERWALLQEMRQLPNDSASIAPNAASLATEPAEAADRQREILRFAAELFSIRLGGRSPQDDRVRYRPGWRTLDEERFAGSQDELRAGRAVATLFLPTAAGAWEPARQLHRGEVSSEWCSMLADEVPGLDTEAFLVFLGVVPEGGLVLVEDGAQGIMPPRSLPPTLADAGHGALPDLKLLPKAAGTEGSHVPSAEQILRSWPWVERIVREESETAGRRMNVAGALGEQPWLTSSANDVLRPIGSRNTAPFFAPRNLVIDPETDRRASVLWRLRKTSPFAPIAALLGAVESLSAEVLERDGAEPARRLLAQLQDLDLDVVGRDPTARQSLVDLFQAIFDAIAQSMPADVPPVPLLTFARDGEAVPLTERKLLWSCPSDEAWIAADNATRESLRRFFPELPLVTATRSRTQLGWLRRREAQIKWTVLYEGARAGVDHAGARIVRARIDAVLPELLALAEVERLKPEGINVPEVRDRWRQLQFHWVENAYVEVRAEIGGGVRGPKEWLRDTRDDVLLLDKTTLLFDTQPGEPVPRRVSLFGESLGQALVNNRAVGKLWTNALSVLESDLENGQKWFEEMLLKLGAWAMASAYRRQLRPLSEEAVDHLRRRTEDALAAIGSALADPAIDLDRLRCLGPLDLLEPQGGWGILDEEGVNRCFAGIAHSDEERAFEPRFACSDWHERKWKAFCEEDHRAERLRDLVIMNTPGDDEMVGKERDQLCVNLTNGLSAFAKERFPYIDFRPDEVAWDWLEEQMGSLPDALVPHRHRPVDAVLPPHERYQPVQKLETAGELHWRPRPVPTRGPTKKEMAPAGDDYYLDQEIARARAGSQAEAAFLGWVERTTQPLLGLADGAGWKLLFDAVAPGGKVQKRLIAAQEGRMTLQEALHISRVWGSAGYDLLGLEPAGAGAKVVRYEVKGISGRGQSAVVHVSPNELAVFQRVARNGGTQPDEPRYRGNWKLIAVMPDGRAADLTEQLAPLLDPGNSPLRILGDRGFEADGIMVWIDRGSSAPCTGS